VEGALNLLTGSSPLCSRVALPLCLTLPLCLLLCLLLRLLLPCRFLCLFLTVDALPPAVLTALWDRFLLLRR
jgi:hypothetical protein